MYIFNFILSIYLCQSGTFYFHDFIHRTSGNLYCENDNLERKRKRKKMHFRESLESFSEMCVKWPQIQSRPNNLISNSYFTLSETDIMVILVGRGGASDAIFQGELRHSLTKQDDIYKNISLETVFQEIQLLKSTYCDTLSRDYVDGRAILTF